MIYIDRPIIIFPLSKNTSYGKSEKPVMEKPQRKSDNLDGNIHEKFNLVTIVG